jgi:hypothetical protein
MKSDNQPSSARRHFLQTTGVAAGAALGSLALPLTADAAAAAVPKKWDATTDVVVVGSGFAGLAAAIEARDASSSRWIPRRGCCGWMRHGIFRAPAATGGAVPAARPWRFRSPARPPRPLRARQRTPWDVWPTSSRRRPSATVARPREER